MRAALMLPWSNSQVEGQVSRLRLVKARVAAAQGSTCSGRA